jgi:hypothetical protein
VVAAIFVVAAVLVLVIDFDDALTLVWVCAFEAQPEATSINTVIIIIRFMGRNSFVGFDRACAFYAKSGGESIKKAVNEEW